MTTAKNATHFSIGFYREDGDFQLLATLNDSYEILLQGEGYQRPDIHRILADEIRKMLWANHDFKSHPKVKWVVLERQDAPDYVTIEEEGK
jgi:hypothetical protein